MTNETVYVADADELVFIHHDIWHCFSLFYLLIFLW